MTRTKPGTFHSQVIQWVRSGVGTSPLMSGSRVILEERAIPHGARNPVRGSR